MSVSELESRMTDALQAVLFQKETNVKNSMFDIVKDILT